VHFPSGFDLVSLAGLAAGSTAAWTFVYGFAVWYGIDHPRLTGRRLTAVAAAGGTTALPLAAVAAVLSAALGAVSGVAVPVWLSLWAAAGPLGLLLTLAYHERLGGRAAPAKWLGLGALAGFAVWPALSYLAVAAVAVGG
jgi:hypothetical protein